MEIHRLVASLVFVPRKGQCEKKPWKNAHAAAGRDANVRTLPMREMRRDAVALSFRAARRTARANVGGRGQRRILIRCHRRIDGTRMETLIETRARARAPKAALPLSLR